ncbi:MAG: hypothetical protein NT007_18460 [Candidatus Kapabacteria bacterium]|nr:hypothetical protein [Candidatus Kapabacteria bacterium]
MIKKLKLLTYLLIFTFISVSCAPRIWKGKELNCPVRQQECKVKTYNGFPEDTSVVGSPVRGYYYSIENVQGINTISDEWQVSFIQKNKAALMFNDNLRQNLMIIRMLNPSRFTLETGVSAPVSDHFGPFSCIDSDVSFASSPFLQTETQSMHSWERQSIKFPTDRIIGNTSIYSGVLKSNQISEIHKIAFQKSEIIFSWISHPSLSFNKSVLFFAAKNDSDFAGIDIWYSIKLADKNWSEPINCGATINSACDELCPFVSQDGKRIYFSSCGHESVGGYDIFYADISSDFWTTAASNDINTLKKNNYFSNLKNAKPPVNTKFDELFPTSPDNYDSLLYFSSNRPNGSKNNFDIYVKRKNNSPMLVNEVKKEEYKADVKIDIVPDLSLPSKMPELESPPFYFVEGYVYAATSKVPMSEVVVGARDLNAIESKVVSKSDGSGYYQLKLDKNVDFEVSAQAEQTFFDTYKIRIEKSDTTSTVRKDFFIPEKFTLRINFPLDEYNNPYKFTIDSVGIETNRTWNEELRLLAKNIQSSIEKINKIKLVGHTDDIASVEYNAALGQRRVDFIIAELVGLGVPRDLLDGRSAGKSELLIRHQNEDLSVYRKRLRRVTLEKILKD